MKYDVAHRRIWFKGEILDVNDAKINILAPTSQFGLNVFEGIPCYWNEEEKQLYAFRLDDHYDRLLRSAKLIQLDCPYTKEDFKKAFVDVIKANEYDENLSVRQTLFVDGFGSWGSDGPVDMFVAPIPRGKTSAEYNKKGLNVCVTSWRRISDETLSPRIKCGANYINSRVGQREALRNGYDTCIFLNEAGKVAEGPGSCFFIVKNGTIITPQLTDSVLESITRDTVIKIAKGKGIPVVERTIDRTELYTCDEAFLCGSAMEMTPVLSIDTDKILSQIEDWQNRPLDEVYPILYIDAIHYSVRDNGVIRKLAAYVILGINTEGKKEVLSITVGDNESSKYWLSVLNELKNRGVKDILIICADGLSGIKEAIAAAFPKTEYQRCIVHQVRNTLKYVPDKDRKAFASDLKTIYHASDEEKARMALDRVTEKWTAKYPNSMRRWYDNWDAITPIFKFSPDVRKVIYTTNAIESLNSTYRKLNRQRSVFPSDTAILKALYLATFEATKKWTMSIRNWGQVYGELSIMYEGRLPE